ncbi:MAG TPA: hypothetical protein PLH27_09240 [bacterium]|nr:hypothetical protein [bacterium]HMW32678.1 hypothetical protein [bacterium]HMW35034.1 hypothetical protein [bacterium]HMY37599.1 hypothetical protein [bacterium]HMZ05796.1 hypothetical protein [bacterium]
MCAANSTDVHIPLKGCRLDRYLCIKTERAVAKDYTIAHHGKLYQLHTRLPLKRVVVEERCDGTMYVVSGDHFVKHTEITHRPMKNFSIYNQPSGWL